MDRQDDGSKRVVRALSSREAIPAEVLITLAREHPSAEFAVEPPRQADWLGWDIDAQSIYRTVEAIAQLRAVAEQWGAVTFVASSSLHPDGSARGVRVYAFLGQPASRWERAALAAWWAHQAGLKTGPGQLELIPQLTPWGADKPSQTQRFSPPFQTDQSILLEDDLTPGPWGPANSQAIADGMAAAADPDRTAEAIRHAIRWQRLTRPRTRLQNPRHTLQIVGAHPLAPGATNDALVRLGGAYARRFRLEPGDEQLHAQAFLAELQSRTDYDTCSDNTRHDLEQGTRAARLLASGIRFNHGGRKRSGRGSTAPSPLSNEGRQRSTLQKLFQVLELARQTWWRSCNQFCAWAHKHHRLHRSWLMNPLIRPIWQWVVTDRHTPSREHRQAVARAGGQPTAPDQSLRTESRPPSYMEVARTTSETDGPLELQTPDPDWLQAFDQARLEARRQWHQRRRAKPVLAPGAAHRRAAVEQLHLIHLERAAGPLLIGDSGPSVSSSTQSIIPPAETPSALAALLAAETQAFWAEMRQARAGGAAPPVDSAALTKPQTDPTSASPSPQSLAQARQALIQASRRGWDYTPDTGGFRNRWNPAFTLTIEAAAQQWQVDPASLQTTLDSDRHHS